MNYWDDWNLVHVQKHHVSPEEAGWVIDHLAPPYPEYVGNHKLRVWGRTGAGRYLQVIFVYHPVSSVDIDQLTFEQKLEIEKVDEVRYVVHARGLTPNERRRYDRRKRL